MSQQPVQKPEVAAGDPNDCGHGFLVQLPIGESHSRWRPSLFEELASLFDGESTKLVYKADPRVELRKASQPFLKAGHPDEHHADATSVEDVSDLLKARHLEPVRFIDHDERGRVRHRLRYPHCARTLFVKCVLGLFRFFASVTVWISPGLAQLLSSIEETQHLRVLALAHPFDRVVVEPHATLIDVTLQLAGRCDDRTGVEDSWLPVGLLRVIRSGVVASGDCLADPRSAEAQTDVPVALAGIAELRESAMLKSLDKVGGGAVPATRCGNA